MCQIKIFSTDQMSEIDKYIETTARVWMKGTPKMCILNNILTVIICHCEAESKISENEEIRFWWLGFVLLLVGIVPGARGKRKEFQAR